MKTLDRYIVGSFVVKLFWAIMAAIVVFLIVNLVDQLDKFLDAEVPKEVIFEYYYLFIPYIAYLVLPVATLLATLFTVGGMVSSNELTAIRAAGIPFTRVAALLIIVSSLSAAAAFWLGEEVIPDANQKRLDIERYQVKRMPPDSRARMGRLYFQLSAKEHLYIDHYRPTTREAFQVEIVTIENGKLLKRIDADKMIWRNGRWHLDGAIERVFTPEGSVLLRKDFNHIIARHGLDPDGFEKVQTKPEEMNWRELRDFIARLKQTGGVTIKWEVERYSKISLPVAAIVIVLFGAPIASIKRRGGTALGFGLALLICFIYFGFIQLGKGLGYNGFLDPWLGAWIGNIFFGVIGVGALGRFVR